MKKSTLRLCAGFMTVILLSLTIVPCYAVTDEYTSTGTFWSSLKEKWWLGFGSKFLIGHLADSACSESPDSRHHGSLKTYAQNSDGSYTAICNYCSADFPVYDADLSAAYDNYVETLPAQGYMSSGGFIWYPTVSDISHLWPDLINNAFDKDTLDSSSRSFSISLRTERLNGQQQFYYSVPFNGTYKLHDSLVLGYRYLSDDGIVSGVMPPRGDTKSVYKSSGQTVADQAVYPGYNPYFPSKDSLVVYSYTLSSFEVIPETAILADTYNINTRPTSITGGNYGIVGDNGQITKVENNSTIINETNNTFYNPATGTTVPIVNWSYDYSDRSYKVTLESGDTATITYGDENITISQITTTEGDTITNNYTIYYLVDGSGSVTPPCDHAWTETNTTPATCTVPGSKLSTCSKCQQTKKDPLPALGHDWQVKQTVTTEYDDTGQLVQQGYTIFECSRCHEQYKSPDGTIPPGGGSGTDPGGEEEDEGFLSWLLGKLGELLGTIGDGILNLLQTALDKIFGGLIDLVNSLFENLAKLVDLFGTVGEAFQVLWTWLPPEIIAILVAGVSIFVFVALLKFFMK